PAPWQERRLRRKLPGGGRGRAVRAGAVGPVLRGGGRAESGGRGRGRLTPAGARQQLSVARPAFPHQEDDPVTVRARYVVAAALGLCAAHLLPAQEPGRLGLEKNAPAAADQQ